MKNLKQLLPAKEWDIFARIYLFGYKIYLVGGSVRDILLGIEPSDYDFATSARPDELIELFRDSNHHLDFVGKSFGVLLIDGIEVATFRGDVYGGNGQKDVVITYVDTIEEDLQRRDLTINAMALDINGDLIDPHGGFEDLFTSEFRCPLIKFVGNPFDRIKEDANRVIRAIRFAARFDGTLDEEAFIAIQESKAAYKSIAPDRIRLEILKTMETTKNASVFWKLLQKTGVLSVVFPDLSRGINHDHGNHHEEDIWTHNMIAGDSVSVRFPYVKLAAYLHDIGKPASYDRELGTFYEHQHFGADIVREHLTRLKFSNDEVRFITNLVLIHMDGTRDMTPKARRRLKNKLGAYGIPWRDYVRLRIADRTANYSKPNFTVSDIKKYIDIFSLDEEVPLSVNDLAIKGGLLIEIFNLTPGPIVSKVQREMLKYVIDEGEEVNTIESLTEFVKREYNW